MRSNHWEYLALLLFALGIALTASALIIHLYYQQHPAPNPQYGMYPIPLLIAGICIMALGIPVYKRSRTKKRTEAIEDKILPPPPQLPPPPPPPQ